MSLERAILCELLEWALDDEARATERRRRIQARLRELGEVAPTVRVKLGDGKTAEDVAEAIKAAVVGRHGHAWRPAADPPRPRKARKGESKYDLARVAEVARATGGVRMADTVAEAFGVSHEMGRFLIRRARKAGHDIPAGNRSASAALAHARRREAAPTPEARAMGGVIRDETRVQSPAVLLDQREAFIPLVTESVTPVPAPDMATARAEVTAALRIGAGRTVERDPWRPAIGGACHQCETCGEPFERIGGISAHVHAAHHRQLRGTERRFTTWEGE